MKIAQSHYRYPVFVDLGGQSHQVSMKLDQEKSISISLLQTFEIERKMDR